MFESPTPHRFATGRLLAAATALALLTVSPVGAEVESTGYVSPSVLFVTAQDDLFVGSSFSNPGTLDITNGSVLAIQHGYLKGNGSYVRVNGIGSEWLLFDDLNLSGSGSPHLLIENGGTVTNIDGEVYGSTGSSAYVVVDGAGSTWNNSGDLFVGGSLNTNGSAYVTISDAGVVNVGDRVFLGADTNRSGHIVFDNGTLNARWGYARLEDLRGTGTINADHWLLSGDYTFTSAADLPSLVVLDDLPDQNITLNLNWSTPLNALEVFGIDDGSMTLNSGFSMTSEEGFVGYSGGDSFGSLTVDGAGTQWTIARRLSVGGQSGGVLNITNGGRVSNLGIDSSTGTYIHVGVNEGASGSIVVDGAGSHLDSAATLQLGGLAYSPTPGRGFLTVTGGGVVDAPGISLVRGAILVSGSGSELSLDALVVFEIHNPSEDETPAVVFADGANIVTPYVSLQGYDFHPAGVLVTGTGTSWTVSDRLLIGDDAHGSVAVEDGALLHTRTATIGYEHLHESPSSVVVTGVGSQWIVDEDLTIGDRGNGILTIADGGHVEVGGTVRVDYVNNDVERRSYIVLDNGTLTAGPGSFLNAENVLGVGTVNVNTWLLEGNHTANSFVELPDQISVSNLPEQDLTINLAWTPEALYDYEIFGVNNGLTTLGGGIDFTSNHGYLGYFTGSDGALTLTGAGTRWDTLNLFAGVQGAGALVIENGAELEVMYGVVLGEGVGATGSVLVTGVGSSWQGGSPKIGEFGHGLFRVEAGATASTGHIYLGAEDGSMGELVVTGAGSALANSNDRIYLGEHGSTAVATIRVLDGGLLSYRSILAERSPADHTIQVDGAGSTLVLLDAITANDQTNHWLSITDGGTVTSADEHRLAGAITIDGLGSRWLLDGELLLGTKQYASLSMTDHAVLNTGNAYIGQNWHGESDAQADVLIDGPGTAWTVNGNLTLGGTISDNIPDPGVYRGTLTIANGGTVTATGAVFIDPGKSGSYIDFNNGTLNANSALVVAEHLRGTGTINADSWLISGDFVLSDLSALPSQIVYDQLPDQDVTVNLAWSDPAQHFEFFGVDDGTVLITNGLTISSQTGYVGFGPSATADLALDGGGADWTITDSLTIGSRGDGTLRVRGGASAQAHGIFIGDTSSAVGLLEVTGPGTTVQSNELYVGRYGVGTLRITDGGVMVTDSTLSGEYAEIGSEVGGSGTVVVTGAGSRLDFGQPFMTLGGDGEGTLRIEDGAVVNAMQMRIATRRSVTGRVMVDNATWNADWVRAGLYGDAIIELRNGATANTPRVWLGLDYDVVAGVPQASSATAIVDGSGTVWNINDGIGVGLDGNGTLDITNGGLVNSASASISNNDPGYGRATVTGPGSQWNNTGDLNIFREGELRIADGGAVAVGGSLNLLNGGLVSFILNDQPNQPLTIALDANLSGALSVAVASGTGVILGESWLLMTIAGERNDVFSNAIENQTVLTFEGLDLLLTYAAGDGNDIGISTAVSGDVDGDDVADTSDLLVIFNHWNQAVAPADRAAGDLSSDGLVNGDDLLRAPQALLALGEQLLVAQVPQQSASPISGIVEGQTLTRYDGIDLLLTYLAGDGDDIGLTTAVSGDADGDGVAGIMDLDLLLANWGDTVTPSQRSAGDLDGDGTVGQGDLDLVMAYWGNNGMSGPQVPEPGSAAALGLIALALTRRRPR